MKAPRAKLDQMAGTGPASAIWINIPSTDVAGIVGNSGCDIAVIDREHGQIGSETASAMITALALQGVPTFVRLPDLRLGDFKTALDSGAAGVIVPQVETAAEAERAVAAFYFSPRGRRGYAGPVVRAAGYGADLDYAQRWNETGILCLEIESRAALASVGEIAAVPGVDMLFFGPHDFALEAQLDEPVRDEALLGAFNAVMAVARQHARLVGTFPWATMPPAVLARSGTDFVTVASDVMSLKAALSDAVAEAGFSRGGRG